MKTPPRPWVLQELTLDETSKRDVQVAVLPVGSTEAHGPHVPYGSDTYHSTAIADRVCGKAHEQGSRVVMLPCLPYGVQGNTMGFPYTLNVEQATLDAMVRDIIDSLEHHGVRKLLIVNGHGGNDFKPLLRSVQRTSPVFVCLADWWKVGSDRVKQIFDRPGEHADEVETSVGLHLFPGLVRFDKAPTGETRRAAFEAIEKGWVSIARPWDRVTVDSTHGDPRKATAEKGEAYVSLVVDRLASFVTQLARTPIDDRFPYR